MVGRRIPVQKPSQQLGDFINGDGIINFDVFGQNLEQLFASGFIVISHKEIIRRTFECLKNGSKECVNFSNFVAKMDECFSEEKICDARKLIKKWAEWTNRKAIQMHKDVLIASNGNALQTIPTVDELAKSFETKCAEKILVFVGWTEKLITPEIRNKEWIVELENQHGILYIGRSMEKLTEKLAKQTYANAEQSTEEIYVFFLEITNVTEEQNDQICRENYDLLLKLSGAGKRCIFVDLTMHSVAKSEYSIGRSHIALFQGSNIIVQDYLEAFKKQQEEEMKEMERKMNTCMARIKDKSNTFKCQNGSQSKKMPTVILELPCPRASEKDQRSDGEPICPDDDNTWECDDCGQLLYVLMPNNKANTTIKNFYCGCGSARIADLTFRCKNSHLHGPDFKQFDSKTLDGLVQRYNKEQNILILGDTGVGKSTLINSLVNVLTYNTLEEALEAEKPQCLIPAKFTLTDEKINSRVIKICQHGVGFDCKECKKNEKKSNENFSAADSCTQHPMAHVIKGIKGGRVRIIDTPGIGDTRGIDQDKRNVKNILSYIAKIDHIHCICILLKPNNARLTVLFRYCIKELLSSLHRNAAKNIVFCFTNTRGTFYRPGDTINPLTIELDELAKRTGVRIDLKKEENVYCVDNEESLNAYLEEKNILEQSMMDQDSQIDALKPEDIKKYQNKLSKLKLSGEQIKVLFDAEKEGRSSQQAYHENTFERVVPRRASNNSQLNYQRLNKSSYSEHGRGINQNRNNNFGFDHDLPSTSASSSNNYNRNSNSNRPQISYTLSSNPILNRLGNHIRNCLPTVYKRN